MIIGGLVGLLLVGGGYLASSRNDGVSPSQLASRAANFCATSARFKEALGAAGVPVGDSIPQSLGSEPFKAVLDRVGVQFDELGPSAPSTIRADVKRVVADFKAASAGNVSGVRTSALTDALKRVIEYYDAACVIPEVALGGQEG